MAKVFCRKRLEGKRLSDKKILIIAYKFPPLGGVGVRRWTKFAKYLAAKGYEVHVVTVNHHVSAKNTWSEDIKSKNITIHRIRSGFPHNLYFRKYDRSFFGRIRNRLKTRGFGILKYIFFLDEAQYWGRYLIPFCGRLIRDENIKNVIATGAPFSVNYFAAKIKKENPSINLINDWRDPWNDNQLRHEKSYHPFKWQITRSEKMEEFALSNSGHVTTVTDGLAELLRERCHSTETRFNVISNGFDPDSFVDMERKPNNNKMVMVYTGNLYAGRELGTKQFLDVINNLIMKDKDFKDKFLLKIYGGFPYGIDADYDGLIKKGVLEIYSNISCMVALG